MSHSPPTQPMPLGPAVVELPLGAAHTERLERAANAAHVLCEALWEALQEQLGVRSEPGGASNGGGAPTRRVADLAEHLADVAATVALIAAEDGHASIPPTPTATHAPRSTAAAVGTAADGRHPAVLVDERDERAPKGGPEPAPASLRRRQAQSAPRPQPWCARPSERPPASQTPPGNEILEEPGREGSAAWIELIGDALAQFERDRLPFTVLIVELLDVEHLWLGGSAGELPGLTRPMESAFTQTLEAIAGRPAASLTSERPDRYWLLVPQTGRLGARALSEQLVRAFTPIGAATGRADPAEQYFAALSAQSSPLPSGGHNRAALPLAVGMAVCPEDGQEPLALAAHAEAELSAVRGAGAPMVSVAEPV